MADVAGDVADVGAGGVERRHDGTAADVCTKSRRIDPDLPGGTPQQLVDLLPGDQTAVGLGEHRVDDHRFVIVDLPQWAGGESLLSLSLLPRSQPFDCAGSEVVDTGGAGGLGGAERSSLGAVDDGSADVGGAGVEVDVGRTLGRGLR